VRKIPAYATGAANRCDELVSAAIESGIIGSPRDFSPESNKDFTGSVPADIVLPENTSQARRPRIRNIPIDVLRCVPIENSMGSFQRAAKLK
jgi:hypothetical protein